MVTRKSGNHQILVRSLSFDLKLLKSELLNSFDNIIIRVLSEYEMDDLENGKWWFFQSYTLAIAPFKGVLCKTRKFIKLKNFDFNFKSF